MGFVLRYYFCSVIAEVLSLFQLTPSVFEFTICLLQSVNRFGDKFVGIFLCLTDRFEAAYQLVVCWIEGVNYVVGKCEPVIQLFDGLNWSLCDVDILRVQLLELDSKGCDLRFKRRECDRIITW